MANIDTKDLLKEISNIKIQVGVEDKILEKNKKHLENNLGIKTPEEAKERLDIIDKKIAKLQKRKQKMIEEAIDMIDKVR